MRRQPDDLVVTITADAGAFQESMRRLVEFINSSRPAVLGFARWLEAPARQSAMRREYDRRRRARRRRTR